jgi:hypothetical protein
MPRYLVLGGRTWAKASNELHDRFHEAGAIIGWGDMPGASLQPLAAASFEARLRFIQSHNTSRRARDELDIRRYRAALPRPAVPILEGDRGLCTKKGGRP